MKPRLIAVLAFGVCALALGLCDQALAQFPARPVRLIVPAAAGGPTDLVARLVSQGLAEAWNQRVIVENRPGAGGIVGTELVVHAAPDGYTLLLSSAVPIVMSRHLMARLPFDPQKDLAPIAQIASVPTVLYASPRIPVTTVAELAAYIKARPGQLNFASAGPGTMPHLAGELFKKQAQLDLVHVPYKGGPAASTAVMSGEAVLYFDTTAALATAAAGKLRALMIASPRRHAKAPDVPTAAEAGLPEFVADPWYGLLAPAKTPRELVERIHTDLAKVLRNAVARERIVNLGFEPVDSSPERFAETIASESARWGAIIRATGIRAD